MIPPVDGYEPIRGKTFPIKDYLKSLGGRWDPTNRLWWVPPQAADEARRVARIGPGGIPFGWVNPFANPDDPTAGGVGAPVPWGPDNRLCWECGSPVRRGSDYSCGCAEPLQLTG